MARRTQDAVQAASIVLIRRYHPWISGAVLAGGAVFSYPGRDYVLIGLMLFLPLLDRDWRLPALPRSRAHYFVWAGLLLAGIALLTWRPSEIPFALTTLLMAAVPEEWFFRAYFMTRLQTTCLEHVTRIERSGIRGTITTPGFHFITSGLHTLALWFPNVAASLLFSLMHGLTRGWAVAALVFLPSLFYGWLYQRARDLPLLVLVHTLSNLIYVLFLAGYVATWAPDLR
jgi:membrane protease YdiL (CAAX protease family)